MVLAPNDLFSWNIRYNKYNEYSITDTFTCFFPAMHTTYSVHAGILKPWRGRLPWPLAVFSFCHIFSLPWSGLNWRSLFPPWGSSPRFPKMAPPFTGFAHTPLPGSETLTAFLKIKVFVLLIDFGTLQKTCLLLNEQSDGRQYVAWNVGIPKRISPEWPVRSLRIGLVCTGLFQSMKLDVTMCLHIL
jgi:hypothetical protein